ncbi:MAG TPA: zf-HC2 domain-containing protein [Gaiellaceae bacterium]
MTQDLEQLSCRELVELVTDYLEGALSDEERARFEAHIGLCGGCRVYLEQMRQTIEQLGHLPEDALSPDAERELLEAFRGWRSA